ncbi:DUF1501 domain-containing protein [Tichowtungia aerotolerans]|uniref:DUF1501 domain-containing protein n=1 Tax=Tichowtungia aerotolerans TaxID=2697043 RepID=A0A6P1MA22_9BACT|nr:DUF1501 domain-containing protein [Tichowtungia aerotolerans]QHI68938.1 DUF1501 domain-containing protein [Tichowtungia aerotolerans]
MKPITRRNMLAQGLCGAGGLMLSNRLQAAPAALAMTDHAKAKSVIQVFLWGGMSHNDTWDPKPGTGRAYMGDFPDVLKTNVDGIQIGQLFPKLAKQADKYSLIRSMTHGINGHETAAYYMQTGHTRDERLAYPSIGAVFSHFKGQNYNGLIPPYVVLTEPQGRFSEEGFMGPKYKPFATGGDPNAARFEVEGVVAKGISDERQIARRELLATTDSLGRALVSPVLDHAYFSKEKAYELILGAGKKVFDLSEEDKKLRDSYGRHKFGQECLVARRLVEAGVPYIVINYPGGWDTHKGHFARMRQQCPQLDQGLAALLEDLSQRGLLDSTLVWCCGEFGRGPKIDWQPPWNGGRNHYGAVFSALVAGGGFRGGQVVGSSTEKAEEVNERPVYPVDLLGSIYHLAGIDPAGQLPHPLGLEARVLPEVSGTVKSGGLLTEIM